MKDQFDVAQASARCLHCAVPRCKAACPIGNEIPVFLRCAQAGDYQSATQTIGHPFGEICGCVCPQDRYCQSGCVLSSRGGSVRISDIERQVFAAHPYVLRRKGDVLSGSKVAVIGGGVSGLTFAAQAYEQGADVTVFERDKLLSTLSLIPSFRLPRQAIERATGCFDGKITVCRMQVGGAALQRIRRDYDIVYLAVGAVCDNILDVPGGNLAVNFRDFLLSDAPCGNVAVIGGGNTAIDCARQAVRRGGSATVVYRRTRADMPAFRQEIEQAQGEGVKFLFNLAPVKLQQQGNLCLTVAETQSEGRGKLTLTDRMHTLRFDAAVCALGSVTGEPVAARSADVLRGAGMYIGGDAAGGKTVAEAVAHALRAIEQITNQRI